MAKLITLDYFGAQERMYYVRVTTSSGVLGSHYHNYFQVCFVLRGEVLHRQGENLVRLVHGDAFIIPPGFSHEMILVDKGSGDSEIYSLGFSDELLHPEYSNTSANSFLNMLQAVSAATGDQAVKLRVMLNDSQRSNVEALMKCLLREQEAALPPQLSASAALLSAILCVLSQSYYQQPQNEAEYNALTVYSQSLSRCIEYIDQHYKEPVTLTALARQFAMSRSMFSNLFPQFTGLSLKQYISKKRILEAEVLIRSSPELSLNEVAELVGYEDSSTFYRNFLRVAGVSPSRYKELCAQDQATEKT